MAARYPRLYADDRGVWEEDVSGHATGFEWDMIVAVTGNKEEGIGGVRDRHVRIELNEEGGYRMGLLSDWAGFAEVAEALTRQLAGITADWLAQIERLEPKDAPLEVWSRPESVPPAGYPRLHADERGVWRENRPEQRFVVEWDKIDGVVGEGGIASDGEVCTCIELELTDKDLPVELHPDWHGFAQVIEAMTDRLPGLAAGWYAEAKRLVALAGAELGGVAATAPIWSRSGPEGYPRLYVDNAGVWRENEPGRRFGLEWDEISGVRCGFWEGSQGETLVTVGLEGKNGALDLGQYLHEFVNEPSSEMIAAITAGLCMPEGWFAKAKELKPTRAPLTVKVRSASPRIRADDRGVWLYDLAQGERLTEWDAIFSVLARRRHQQGRPKGTVSIVLDLAGLGRRSLHEEEPGFAEAVEALAARLGLPAAWRAGIERLQPGQASTVWRRAYPEGYPRILADDRGVWRENSPGERFGQPWDGIWRVVGRKLEGTPGQIEVELSGTGPGLCFQFDCQGLADVIEAIAARLPGLQTGWLDKVERWKPGHALWRKGWIIADERVGSDGLLAITWAKADDHRARKQPSAAVEPAPQPNSPPPLITADIARKVLAIIEAELSLPLYESGPGFASVEGPLCDVLGLPRSDGLGDSLGWVSTALYTLTGKLVGSNWTTGKARAQGLRRLALAQLGSHALDDRAFARHVAEMTIRTVVPRALRTAAADLPSKESTWEALLAAAGRCEREGTREAANAAEVAARSVNESAFVSDAAHGAARAAWHAAMAAAAAAGDTRQYAGSFAGVAAARLPEAAAYDAAFAAAYTGRNAELTAFAASVLEILIDMRALGCQWLDLAERQRERD